MVSTRTALTSHGSPQKAHVFKKWSGQMLFWNPDKASRCGVVVVSNGKPFVVEDVTDCGDSKLLLCISGE